MATRRRRSTAKATATAPTSPSIVQETKVVSVKKSSIKTPKSVNKVTQPKVKKVIDPTDTSPVIINLPEGTNLKKVVRTETDKGLDLQKLVKDYPRDGFSLFLLPFLLLEAITKEGLKLVDVNF